MPKDRYSSDKRRRLLEKRRMSGYGVKKDGPTRRYKWSLHGDAVSPLEIYRGALSGKNLKRKPSMPKMPWDDKKGE